MRYPTRFFVLLLIFAPVAAQMLRAPVWAVLALWAVTVAAMSVARATRPREVD